MSRKDARDGRGRKQSRTALWSFMVGSVVVVGACFVARAFWGPDAANAQQRQQQGAVRRGAAKTATSGQRQDARAAATAPRTQNNGPRGIPAVVAVVNQQQITREQLGQQCLRRFGKEVLESIVNKHLIWQECQHKGVAITDQDVETEVARVASKFGLPADRWLAMLSQEREISPAQYRREIIWPTLALRRLAADEIKVTPQQLREAFEGEYGAKVKVRLISVAAQDKAKKIHALAVAKPDSFPKLAKQYSEDASAAVQGMIPPIRRHMDVPEVENAAFKLKAGEISPIIPVANQFLILKCEKQIAPTYIAAKFRADAEQRLADRLRDQKMRGAAAKLFQRLQKDANVVNVMNDPQMRAKMPGVAATINNQQVSVRQLSDECIIRHGEEVLEGEINRLILTQALKRSGKAVAEQDIDREIARAADAFGYIKEDGSPHIEEWLKKVTAEQSISVDLYVTDAVWPSVALKKLVDTSVSVTKEDITRGFESNYGPRVEVLAIVLNNQRQAQRVWEMAQGNPTDQFFGELAAQYSADPVSRENMGKVPPLRKFGGQPLMEKEAFKLQAGEMSGIIVIGDKYIVLRCQGRTKPIVTEMDKTIEQELYKEIHERKMRSAMARQFDQLIERASVQNYLSGSVQMGRTTSRPTTRTVR